MKESSKIYTHKCKNGTTATVTFSRPSNQELHMDMCSLQPRGIQPDDWIFSRCDYIMNRQYTLEDWEDLHELSGEILKLNKELTQNNELTQNKENVVEQEPDWE